MSLRPPAEGHFTAQPFASAGQTVLGGMYMGKADLIALLETDARARDFYLALPADVRGRIGRDPGDIGSFADLRARAARAARGR